MAKSSKNGSGFGHPSQQRLFNVLPLSALDLAVVFVAMEVEKVIKRRRSLPR